MAYELLETHTRLQAPVCVLKSTSESCSSNTQRYTLKLLNANKQKSGMPMQNTVFVEKQNLLPTSEKVQAEVCVQFD